VLVGLERGREKGSGRGGTCRSRRWERKECSPSRRARRFGALRLLRGKLGGGRHLLKVEKAFLQDLFLLLFPSRIILSIELDG
jgi:hypothetical protein